MAFHYVHRTAHRLVIYSSLTTPIYAGVESVEADHSQNKVVVTGSADPDEMLAAIKKTGKTCELRS